MNKEFNENKKKYLNELAKNAEIVKKLLADEIENFGIQTKNIGIFLNPNTEEELRYSNIMFNMTKTFLMFQDDLKKGNIKKLDLEKSKMCKFFADLTIFTRNGNEEELIKAKTYLSGNYLKRGAKDIYEMRVINSIQQEELLEQLLIKTGYDKNNQDSVKNFIDTFAKGNEIVKTETIHEDIDPHNPKILDDMEKFYNDFLNLYTNGVINKKSISNDSDEDLKYNKKK